MAKTPSVVPLVVTCEHASAAVPSRYRSLFANNRPVLATHTASDMGALVAARLFSRLFATQVLAGQVTRLLVDLNRSLDHPQLFSAAVQKLDGPAREALVHRYYQPHRDLVIKRCEQAIKQYGRVLHLGVHSFTPVLRGKRRDFEAGLLYDPRRSLEADLAGRWLKAIGRSFTKAQAGTRFRVYRNRPYRGSSDGLTTTLRAHFAPRAYLGFELELNQAWCCSADAPNRVRVLAEALMEVIASRPRTS